LRCTSCGEDASGWVGHHVSYDPERRMPVCKSCHGRIHSHRSTHSLLPDYMPLKKTRSKTGVTMDVDGQVLARIERMALEEGLQDVNHALETLCSEYMTDEEKHTAQFEYSWHARHGVVSVLSRSERIREKMAEE